MGALEERAWEGDEGIVCEHDKAGAGIEIEEGEKSEKNVRNSDGKFLLMRRTLIERKNGWEP